MKEACRICAGELRGNQRRWIFHPAAKLNLQVLLSHALRHGLQRDGRREFICSKCCFMLDRMFRFDAVIARVQALSLERLRRLLQERDRLRQCITALYNRNNGLESSEVPETVGGEYCTLLQEDLMYCMQESWAGDEEEVLECSHNPLLRRCRVCRVLRVPDSLYEAVCKVPRKVARSVSCGPSSRYSATNTEEQTVTSNTLLPETSLSDGQCTLLHRESFADSLQLLDKSHRESEERLGVSEERLAASEERLGASDERHGASEERLGASEERLGASEERLGASEERLAVSEERLAFALSLLQDCVYRPIRTQRGSKLPVLMNPVFFTGRDTLDRPDQENMFDVEKHVLEEPALDPALEELWKQEEYMSFCLRSLPKVKRCLMGQ